MNDKQSSRFIGRSENYFASLKNTNKELYTKYYELGKGNLAQGYLAYQAEYEVIRDKAVSIYYQVFENEVMLLEDLQLQINAHHFESELSHRNMLTRYLFQQNDNISKIEKRREILENIVEHFKHLIGE